MNRICLFCLSLSFLATPALVAEKPALKKRLKLFAGETWYKKQAGKERSFEGVLTKAKRGGGIGFGRFNPYRLRMDDGTREVYMGGRKVLDPYVGTRVRLRGKAVDMRVEGQFHREIWPAELATLGVVRQSRFIAKTDPKPRTLVLRSNAALQKALDEETLQKAARSLGRIDFKKQMVILVKSGRTNAFGVRITVNSLDVSTDGKSATLHWTYRPYLGGAAPPRRPGNPGAIAVVERFKGDVKFRRKNYRLPTGAPLPRVARPQDIPRRR
ncbi:MAG: hypothetical protein ACE5KM_20130 [Planctomycetaceae bacterium]